MILREVASALTDLYRPGSDALVEDVVDDREGDAMPASGNIFPKIRGLCRAK